MKIQKLLLWEVILIALVLGNKELSKESFIKTKYYKDSYKERYKQYKKMKPLLTKKQVVQAVNLQQDKKPYEGTEKSPNIGKKSVLVNKHFYLGQDYIPPTLEKINENYSTRELYLSKEAKNAWEKLAQEMKKKGLSVYAISAYRSYEYQDNLYKKYVKLEGIEKADTYSARPGYSEHQTGLALDISNGIESYENFHKTNEYEWIKEHAYEYGFIERYPKGKEDITGYQYEPWHYRYVGLKLAYHLYHQKITLEEYYATKKGF